MRIFILVIMAGYCHFSFSQGSSLTPQVITPSEPSSATPIETAQPAVAPVDNKASGASNPPSNGDSKLEPAQILNSLVGALAGAAAMGVGGNPRTYYGDDPPENADWSTYEYPDTHKFYYGGAGAGNIGSGLCTAKNADRTQVKNGYCGMLADVLRAEGSCANKAMNEILRATGPDGNGIGDLNQYCSTFGRINSQTNRVLVFQQVLAALITQESGWNPRAQEPPWTKNGQPMGGKGLFQIGVNDRSQDADCAGINSESIFDPATNIKCGACIALKNLAKDRTMGHGSGDANARGMARYFGPLRDSQVRKRSAMAAAVNEYCIASTGSGQSNPVLPGTEQ